MNHFMVGHHKKLHSCTLPPAKTVSTETQRPAEVLNACSLMCLFVLFLWLLVGFSKHLPACMCVCVRYVRIHAPCGFFICLRST